MQDRKFGAAQPSASPATETSIAVEHFTAPFKLLFLNSAPSNADKLHVEKELREVDRRMDYAMYRDRCQLKPELAVTPGELGQILLRHLPTVVHFSGHGTQDGRLVLQNEQGFATPVSRAAITALFAALRNKGIRCVVLSACYAEDQASAIAEHIEFVVGIKGAIFDAAGLSFAAGFYGALAAGSTVQEAFELGVVQILLLNQGQEDATPRLICRANADPQNTRLI